MRKGLTEVVFILDRSGSMQNLTSDTIGGFNSMIENQKNEEGEAFVTTVLFDDNYELLHDHVNIQDVKPITNKEYYARGCTALLDAVGKTINSIGILYLYIVSIKHINTIYSTYYFAFNPISIYNSSTALPFRFKQLYIFSSMVFLPCKIM